MRRLIRYFWSIAAAVALAVLSPALAIGADDWLVARGDPEGSGVAESALPDKLEVLWTYRAAADAGFEATAVVAGGVIYLGDNLDTFHAVQLADGQAVWTKQFEDTGFLAGAALDVDEQRLYVGDAIETFRCLSMTDGKEIWDAELDAQVYAGPTLVDGHVLVTCEAGTLTSFDTEQGDERWEFHIEAPLRCSPTLVAGRALLAGCDSQLHIISVRDGIEVGSVPIDAPTGATAAIRGNMVYFGTEGGTFYGIDVNEQDAARSRVAWTFRDPARGQPIRSAAAVTDKIVVYGSQGKAVYGLDAKTGQLKWQTTERSRVDSSPVIAGSSVVAATTGGKLLVLDAATGKPTWSFDAGGSFLASPVVVDGRIVIGNTDGSLYCFGAKPDSEEQTDHRGTQNTEKN
jgi:outer membrane protein assembly factor BamB